MNKIEKQLFWELCSFIKPNKHKLKLLLNEGATPEVLGQLFFNRMQAVAYGVLKESELLHELNREFRNSLAYAYQQNVEKNKSFFQCIDIINKALSKQKNKYAMLKGALLCGLYPSGYRTSNDIDLLVHPKDLTEISNALTIAGFRQGNIKNGKFNQATRNEIIESKMTRGETIPYILEVNLPYMPHLEVDINFSLDYKNSNAQTLESMLSKVKEFDAGDNKILTLDKYDFFIHLCCHLYKEATTLPWVNMKRDMTLYKFCDIYMLLNKFTPTEIKELFTRAKELGTADICSCAIVWTSCLFSIPCNYSQEYANNMLFNNASVLDEVISPSEHKLFIYTEKNIRKRFFAKDRKLLLKEVEQNA